MRFKLPQEAPKIREECLNNIRPCIWLRCKYHMFWFANGLKDRNLRYRKLKKAGLQKQIPKTCYDIMKNKSDDDIIEILLNLKDTCVLDIADRGGVTLEEIAALCGMTRERIRQLEFSAIERIQSPGVKDIKLRQERKILSEFAQSWQIDWFGEGKKQGFNHETIHHTQERR